MTEKDTLIDDTTFDDKLVLTVLYQEDHATVNEIILITKTAKQIMEMQSNILKKNESPTAPNCFKHMNDINASIEHIIKKHWAEKTYEGEIQITPDGREFIANQIEADSQRFQDAAEEVLRRIVKMDPKSKVD